MKKRILFVTTNFSKINENIKTGVWFEEFAVPFLVFEKTGYELVVASPLGGNSPIDVNSLSCSNPMEWDKAAAKFAFKKCLNTLIIFVYPAFFFLFMVFVNHMGDLPLSKFADVSVDFSIFILMTAILIPMLSDTFAMLTGSLIGGKKLCPRISPGKTISGTVGGAVWTLLLMSAVWLIFANINGFDFMWSSFPIWAYLIIILIGVGIAVAGDLFESILKRHSGVKDSGRLVPGHGGILDRIDSYIFIAPYIMLAFWIFAL